MQNFDVAKEINNVCALFLAFKELRKEIEDNIRYLKKRWFVVCSWWLLRSAKRLLEQVNESLSMCRFLYVKLQAIRVEIILSRKKLYKRFLKKGFSMTRILKHEKRFIQIITSELSEETRIFIS